MPFSACSNQFSVGTRLSCQEARQSRHPLIAKKQGDSDLSKCGSQCHTVLRCPRTKRIPVLCRSTPVDHLLSVCGSARNRGTQAARSPLRRSGVEENGTEIDRAARDGRATIPTSSCKTSHGTTFLASALHPARILQSHFYRGLLSMYIEATRSIWSVVQIVALSSSVLHFLKTGVRFRWWCGSDVTPRHKRLAFTPP